MSEYFFPSQRIKYSVPKARMLVLAFPITDGTMATIERSMAAANFMIVIVGLGMLEVSILDTAACLLRMQQQNSNVLL